jgi:hypothetical protein
LTDSIYIFREIMPSWGVTSDWNIYWVTEWILDLYYHNVLSEAYAKIVHRCRLIGSSRDFVYVVVFFEFFGCTLEEGITRWFHKLRKNLYIKNSIYLALLGHLLGQCTSSAKYIELFQHVSPSAIAIFFTIHCTPDHMFSACRILISVFEEASFIY